MRKRTKRAFIISSVAHAAALLGLAVAGLLSNCSEKEPSEHVFKLVSSPPPAAIVAPPVPAPRPTPPRPEPVKRSPPKPTPPKPTPPKPTPPKLPPPPKKTLPKKPSPRPVPKKPQPPPRKVSFKEFSKDHPKKSRPKPSPQPVVRTPVFNPNDFQVTAKIPEIQVVGSVSPRDPNAFSNYLGRVKSLIEQEWRRLQASANLRGSGALVVETKVEFRIGRSGELRSSRLVRSSSYSEFDQ